MENTVLQSNSQLPTNSTKAATKGKVTQEPSKKNQRWTDDEDKRLIRQVMAFPQNLNRCFIMVAEETGRSRNAVASHWYSVLSKKPEVYCFFTASSTYVSRNRKNGVGVLTKPSIWQKLLDIVKKIC